MIIKISNILVYMNILVHMDMKYYIHQIGFRYFFGRVDGWMDGWLENWRVMLISAFN